MVQFLQINLHHSKAAPAAHLTRLATGHIDVVLIQEPWIVGNKICGLSTPLYKLFYTKDKGKTRTCIHTKTLHNNSYTHTHLRNSSWVGTLIHTTHNGEVQTQTKGVSYSTTISINQIYSSATKVMTQLSSLEIAGKS